MYLIIKYFTLPHDLGEPQTLVHFGFSLIIAQGLVHCILTVADPGFPRSGSPTEKVVAPSYYLANCLVKTA